MTSRWRQNLEDVTGTPGVQSPKGPGTSTRTANTSPSDGASSRRQRGGSTPTIETPQASGAKRGTTPCYHGANTCSMVDSPWTVQCTWDGAKGVVRHPGLAPSLDGSVSDYRIPGAGVKPGARESPVRPSLAGDLPGAEREGRPSGTVQRTAHELSQSAERCTRTT